MTPFADTLRQTSDRLTLPQPARSRVLLEIAADMDDLFAVYLDRGLSEDEARRQTLKNIDLDDETLAQLAVVHSGAVRRVLDKLSTRTLQFWERALLLLVVVSAFIAGDWLLKPGQIIRDSGPFAWPILVVTAGALIIVCTKFYQLFLKQDHTIRRLHGYLNLLLSAAVLLMFLGFSGSWVEVWRLQHTAATDTLPVLVYMMQWAMQTTALLQLSLGLALLCALAWFGLAGKVSRIERHEAEILLDVS